MNAKCSKGFTLFEVIIGLTILSLLAGSVYAIVWRAGETAAEVREFDQRDEEVARFLGMMRRTIEAIPQGGAISMAAPSETGTEFYEMTISDAATAFSFGENPATAGETIIGMRPQSEEDSATLIGSESIEATLYQVAISRGDFMPGDADGDGMVFRAGGDNAFLEADEQGRYWLPLLNHVTEMSWRFWDETQSDWIEEWTDDSRMPLMLELSLSDPYRPAPLRLVFDVPDHLTQAQQQDQQPAAPAEEPETSGGGSTGASTQTRPGGDRPQPGQRDGRSQRGDGKGSGFKGKGGGFKGKGKSGPGGKGPGGGGGDGRGPGGGGGRGPGGGGNGGGGTAPPGNPGGGGGGGR